MPLPAGYAINPQGWIFETTSGQGYGPFRMTAGGAIEFLGSGVLISAIVANYKKGTNGLWYKISDNSGPFAVNVGTVQGLMTAINP
jgi:hypothetical protein